MRPKCATAAATIFFSTALRVGYIAGDGKRPAAGPPSISLQRRLAPAPCWSATFDDHAGTAGRQLACQQSTDVAPGAGHDGDAAVQFPLRVAIMFAAHPRSVLRSMAPVIEFTHERERAVDSAGVSSPP